MKSLKVNDKVLIIAGDHKGEEAKIAAVDRAGRKAMLEGIGLAERHLRKTKYNPNGGKKTVHVGIDFSNLKLVEAAEFSKAAGKSGKKTDKATGKATDKAGKADKKAKKGAK